VIHTEWLASLSPWPEEFGLSRMHELLARLDKPERAFPAVHVVGTNGKSTATRTIAAYLRADGLRVGAYTSPHVSGWHERLDTDARAFEEAVARVRPVAEEVGATQFETVTAAALAQFAADGVDAAVVEAGLGGRLDATNVLDARVVHLTNVALEHTDVLGETREQIAREKLAVAGRDAIVVLGEPEWSYIVPGNDVRPGGARETAEAFLGRRLDGGPSVAPLPGRLEQRSETELWDGAHTPEAVDWLLRHLERDDWIVVASVLRDKDVDGIVRRLTRAGSTFIATRSSSVRAVPERELAATARRYFDHVEAVADPTGALLRARRLGPVLVTGSLYLLADLYPRELERVRADLG